LRKSSCSARDCLGDPVETPESDPPLEVESRSLLQGTDADRRIVTVDPMDEEREREHNTFSETLDLGMVTYPEQNAEFGKMLSKMGELGGGGAGHEVCAEEGMLP